MNSNPNKPNDASLADQSSAQSPERSDRYPKADPRQGAGAVEAKLKEAQASLMEAEGKLMATTAVASSPTASPPPASDAQRRPYANATTETPMNARTPALAERAAAEPPRQKQPQAPAVPPTEHLPENVAGMLCYLFGWVSGLVFLLFDRRPFVRFHAAQSVAVFATLSIVLLALSDFFLGAFSPRLAHPLDIVSHVVELVWLVAAVVLMLKAAAGERYHVKGASQYAERAAHGAK